MNPSAKLTEWRKCLGATLALVLLAPAAGLAAPGDILYSESFEDGSLAPWVTTDGTRSGVSNLPGFAGSGAFGAFTRWNPVTVTSPTFNAAVPDATLTVWVRRGDDSFSELPDDDEDLVLEYQRADSSWVALRTYPGLGTGGQVFNDSFGLPADALHGALAIRFRQTEGSGSDFDYWHFDDIVVIESGNAPLLGIGTCEEFDAGLSTNWTVNAAGGIAGTSNVTFQSPSSSLFLANDVIEITSNVIDTSDPAFGELTVWVRRGDDAFSEDPDFNENLVIEYFNDVGSWVALETFTGSGTPGQVFIRAYDLPDSGRHTGFQLRIRQTGGSGNSFDYWHVDDVCFELSTDPVLMVAKLAMPISDPFNSGPAARAVPGAIVQYTISVTNQGLGATDAGTLAIADTVPANTALFVDTSSGDPFVFVDGATSSGLTYSYATDVTYSTQPGGGPPFDYTPPAGTQFDPSITGFRINPGGSMNAAGGGGTPSFNIVLRVRIN